MIKKIEKPDCVINFNYDFDFLKNSFDSKTIFIINDDFIEMSRFWMKKQSQRMEISTIRNSDQVLTVSKKIIFKYINNFKSKFTLFLPWAQERYKQPKKNLNRKTVLFYGYIDNRIDWPLLSEIIKNTDYYFTFVGPILDRSVREKIKLSKSKNFNYLKSSKLNGHLLDDVFCSLIPYSEKIKGVDAVTVSNRTIQLLSF